MVGCRDAFSWEQASCAGWEEQDPHGQIDRKVAKEIAQ